METPEFVEHDGKLYLFWDEDRGGNFVVRGAVFNGDLKAPSFSSVDNSSANGINFNGYKDGYYPHAVSCGGRLYVTWEERGELDSGTGVTPWLVKVAL